MAFAHFEPIGDRRGDWQAAMIAAQIANANRDTKKRPKPYKPDEFLLEWEMPGAAPQRQTWQEQLRTVEMLNAAFGGEDRRHAHDG
jgi:hypothetical protein